MSFLKELQSHLIQTQSTTDDEFMNFLGSSSSFSKRGPQQERTVAIHSPRSRNQPRVSQTQATAQNILCADQMLTVESNAGENPFATQPTQTIFTSFSSQGSQSSTVHFKSFHAVQKQPDLAEKVANQLILSKLPELPGTMRRFRTKVLKKVAENIKLRNQAGEILTSQDIIDGVRQGKKPDEFIQNFGLKNTPLYRLNQQELDQLPSFKDTSQSRSPYRVVSRQGQQVDSEIDARSPNVMTREKVARIQQIAASQKLKIKMRHKSIDKILPGLQKEPDSQSSHQQRRSIHYHTPQLNSRVPYSFDAGHASIKDHLDEQIQPLVILPRRPQRNSSGYKQAQAEIQENESLIIVEHMHTVESRHSRQRSLDRVLLSPPVKSPKPIYFQGSRATRQLIAQEARSSSLTKKRAFRNVLQL